MAAAVIAQNVAVPYPVHGVALREASPNAAVILPAKGASGPPRALDGGDGLRLPALWQGIYDMARRGEMKARVIDAEAF